MSIDLTKLVSGAVNLPPRVLIYGTGGIGKTTFAACAPSPVFLRTEDGMGMIDLPAFPVAGSFGEVMDALESLATQDHGFKTLVVDSIDWLEPLIWKRVCEQEEVKSIEQISYGKGYMMAMSFWAEYIEGVNYLRREKDMTIIQIAHAEIKRYDDPANEPYDRYQVKLHKLANAKIVEHSDVVLFANYRTATRQVDIGMGAKKTKAVGSGDRYIYTEERPAFIAKNRYQMPPELPMEWKAFADFVPYYNQAKKEK